MIAFSCVHCGQRMKITEEDGCKRATCSGCGRVVLIPAGETSSRLSRRGRGSASGEPQTNPRTGEPEPTRLVTPVPSASFEPESHGRTNPAIHDLPTRTEEVPGTEEHLTAFLAPAERADEIGRLGGYRVLGLVGAGGMGVVFRAHDPQLDRIVALKAMLPSLAHSVTARQRFLREARSAAAIQHDHVVTIHQVGEDRGVPFLAMPFLKGESLDARLHRQGGPLPVAESLRIGRQIAEGLAAIHELGLVHRDIKPANVFLEGETGRVPSPRFRVKILDFGLARAVTGDVQLTQEGSIVGSPAFMAPEQASRQPIDARADLFSLGCVMYLMLTGLLPFEGPDALTTLLAVQTAKPVEPAKCNPMVREEVSELVMALLEKDPAKRLGPATRVMEACEEREG